MSSVLVFGLRGFTLDERHSRFGEGSFAGGADLRLREEGIGAFNTKHMGTYGVFDKPRVAEIQEREESSPSRHYGATAEAGRSVWSHTTRLRGLTIPIRKEVVSEVSFWSSYQENSPLATSCPLRSID